MSQTDDTTDVAGMPYSLPENWYPDPEDPSRLRWWNGITWTTDTRAPSPPTNRGHMPPLGLFASASPPPGGSPAPGPPPPVKTPSKAFRFLGRSLGAIVVIAVGGFLALIMLIVLIGVALDSDTEVNTVAATTTTEATTTNEVATTTGAASDPTTTERTTTTQRRTTTTESDDLGTLSNPVPLGSLSMTAEGWSGRWEVLPTEVRRGLPLDRWDDVAADQECVAVLYDLTLLDLPEGEITSNMFGNPDLNLVVDGRVIDGGTCGFDSLQAEGLSWALDIELTEGASTKAFVTFVVGVADEIDVILVEDIAYTADANTAS